NGNPSASYAGAISLDIDSVPLPPWPAGNLLSLAWPTPISGLVNALGDLDRFTFSLTAGQTLSATLSGAITLQPSLELLDPSGGVIAASHVPAGGAALLQQVPAPSTGLYTLRVTGDVGS